MAASVASSYVRTTAIAGQTPSDAAAKRMGITATQGSAEKSRKRVQAVSRDGSSTATCEWACSFSRIALRNPQIPYASPKPIRSRPATDSSRWPQIWSAPSPRTTASAPSAADTVTWPRPQASVMRAVFPADQRRARANAAKGTQWSGASECSAPTGAAANASAQNSGFTVPPPPLTLQDRRRAVRSSFGEARRPQRLHVERTRLAVHDDLGQQLPERRRVHDAVPGGGVAEVQVVAFRRAAEQRVLVGRHLVQTRPGPGRVHGDSGKRWHPLRGLFPHLLEPVLLDGGRFRVARVARRRPHQADAAVPARPSRRMYGFPSRIWRRSSMEASTSPAASCTSCAPRRMSSWASVRASQRYPRGS